MPISTFEEARQRLIDSLKKPATAPASARSPAKSQKPGKVAGKTAGARKKKP